MMWRGWVIALALITGAAACGGDKRAQHHDEDTMHHEHKGGHHHDFSGAEGWAQRFDAPDRDGWQRPEEVIAAMQITPGMTVADVGAGTGYFLAHLSRAVGEQGRVWGLDPEADMVRYMKERAAREGLLNVDTKQIPLDGPGVEDSSLDRVLIVNTWHHIEGREAYAARLKRALKPGGKVVIVDFTAEAEQGPPPAMRLSARAVIEELERGGLRCAQVEEGLPRQYIVVAE